MEPGRLAERPNRAILVVDDDAPFLETVLDVLRDAGLAGIGASDVPDAVSQLERSPQIGCVLTDVQLPGRSGIDLAIIISERWPRMEVALMSAQAPPLPGWAGSDLPFLRKPFRLNDLFRVIGQPNNAGGVNRSTAD